MPNFPSDPANGTQVVEKLPNGDLLIWTYDRHTNSWTSEYWQGGHDPGLIYTRDVKTTPSEIIEGLATKAEPNILETQEQVNDLLAAAATTVARATSRASDQVDFLQNSVGKGVWLSGEGVVDGDDYPGPGEFWANNTDFRAITKFKFNDSGLPGFTNPGSLEGSKVGDYLTVQTNDNNSFGQYVIKGLTTENVGKSGLIIRTFEVALIRDARSLGDLSPLDRCSVTVARPMSVIVQDNQPVVSTRGIFWYRESDDHLLISNYADGFTGEGPQWTDLTAGGDGQYLPLTGGTIDGQLTINKGPLMVNSAQVVELPTGGDLFTVLGSDNGDAIFVINGAGSGKYLGKQTVDENIATVGYVSNYLPRAGGVMDYNSVLASKDSNGVTKNLFTYKGSELEFRAEVMKFKELSKLKMGGTYNNAIIEEDEGFTDNSLVPTLGFVKSRVNRGLEGVQNTRNIRPYKFVNNKKLEALGEGEIAFFDNDMENVSKPEDCFIMGFSGVNKTGERSAPDGDAIDYESFLGGHVSILNGDLTKTYMRVHGYGGIPSFTQINYFKDNDVYTIGWPDNMASPKVSTFTQFSNGQTVNLRVPDLFL
jgi:hypothetical protein